MKTSIDSSSSSEDSINLKRFNKKIVERLLSETEYDPIESWMKICEYKLSKKFILNHIEKMIEDKQLYRLFAYQKFSEKTIVELLPYLSKIKEDPNVIWEMICFQPISVNFIKKHIKHIENSSEAVHALIFNEHLNESSYREFLYLFDKYHCFSMLSISNISISFIKEFFPKLNKRLLMNNEFLDKNILKTIIDQYGDLIGA